MEHKATLNSCKKKKKMRIFLFIITCENNLKLYSFSDVSGWYTSLLTKKVFCSFPIFHAIPCEIQFNWSRLLQRKQKKLLLFSKCIRYCSCDWTRSLVPIICSVNCWEESKTRTRRANEEAPFVQPFDTVIFRPVKFPYKQRTAAASQQG